MNVSTEGNNPFHSKHSKRAKLQNYLTEMLDYIVVQMGKVTREKAVNPVTKGAILWPTVISKQY